MSILTRLSVNTVMHRDVARERGISEKSPLVDKIRALRGLKISGFTAGAFGHQIIVHYMLKAGLDPQKDIRIVGLGTAPALLVALEKRQIDAFVMGTPLPEAAAARGYGVMVVDNSAGEDPDFAEFMMDVLMVPPETMKQRPELIRKVVRALLKKRLASGSSGRGSPARDETRPGANRRRRHSLGDTEGSAPASRATGGLPSER